MLIVKNTTRRRLSMLSLKDTLALNITDGVVFGIDMPLVSGSLMS